MDKKDNPNTLKLKKIYLFDDANENSRLNMVIDKLDQLMGGFFDNYLITSHTDSFEAYVGNRVYSNNGWQLNNNGNDTIGFNDYTNKLLNEKLKAALSDENIALLIDYYLVDNPKGDNVETALNYLKSMLTTNKQKLTDNKIRILFYSAWPNPNMAKDIRELEIPNIYFSRINFKNDIEILKFNFREIFRVVNIKEKNKKDS